MQVFVENLRPNRLAAVCLAREAERHLRSVVGWKGHLGRFFLAKEEGCHRQAGVAAVVSFVKAS